MGNILQTLLGVLLCMVDMRLGLGEPHSVKCRSSLILPVALIFFLWRHYAIQHERENDNAKEEREKEKKDIQKKISEAKKGGASRSEMDKLRMMLEELG